MHYGSSFGHYSMVELVPSSGLGVFTAINGGQQSSSYSLNTLLHTYILDLMIQGNSWLTPQRACEFEQLHYNFQLPFERNHSAYDFRKYYGLYYNPMFSNLTIEVRSGNPMLIYGTWQFYLYHENNMFYIEPITSYWLFLYDIIVFHPDPADSQVIHSVDIHFLEPKVIPRFVKYQQDWDYENWKYELEKKLCSPGNVLSVDKMITWPILVGYIIIIMIHCLPIY